MQTLKTSQQTISAATSRWPPTETDLCRTQTVCFRRCSAENFGSRWEKKNIDLSWTNLQRESALKHSGFIADVYQTSHQQNISDIFINIYLFLVPVSGQVSKSVKCSCEALRMNHAQPEESCCSAVVARHRRIRLAAPPEGSCVPPFRLIIFYHYEDVTLIGEVKTT